MIKYLCFRMQICRCGGIGRHKGLKIPRPKKRTGSTPVSGTKKGTPVGYRGISGVPFLFDWRNMRWTFGNTGNTRPRMSCASTPASAGRPTRTTRQRWSARLPPFAAGSGRVGGRRAGRADPRSRRRRDDRVHSGYSGRAGAAAPRDRHSPAARRARAIQRRAADRADDGRHAGDGRILPLARLYRLCRPRLPGLHAGLEYKATPHNSAKAFSARFFVEARFETCRCTLCTRKGHAASVGRQSRQRLRNTSNFSEPTDRRKISGKGRSCNCAALP